MLQLHAFPFLNREAETARLQRFAARPAGGLAVLYGRRRCGKSRLLLESLPADRLVYYLADEREPALQRAALAAELASRVPGFDEVIYPEWEALFARWWAEAPSGTILVLDEFPALVQESPEIPSLLQRRLDRQPGHLVLCGSSQRLMHGLVLDRSAPLFGRAREILKIRPLGAGWIREGLGLEAEAALEAYAVWGGVPHYWQLAAEFADWREAVTQLVLDPLGVLHEEPSSLLLDDLRDVTQSTSILQLVGQGCHRLSEIASRLGKPAGALVRPMQRLLDLELVAREKPFGSPEKDSKRTLYRVADPLLSFWYRFVAPHRSWLGAGQVERVWASIQPDWSGHVGGVWEELARLSVPHSDLFGVPWKPASRWWGAGSELDVVAESVDGASLLLGSVKWEERSDLKRVRARLQEQAAAFPLVAGRQVHLACWLKRGKGPDVMGPEQVLSLLR